MVMQAVWAVVLFMIGPIVWALTFLRRQGQEYHPGIAAAAAIVVMFLGSWALTDYAGSVSRSLDYSFQESTMIVGAVEVVVAVLYMLVRLRRRRATR